MQRSTGPKTLKRISNFKRQDKPEKAMQKTPKKVSNFKKQTEREKVIEKIKDFQKKCSEATNKRKDMEAHNSMTCISVTGKNRGPNFTGPVPGIEVGDSFQYRAELSLIGLHKHLQAGVSYIRTDRRQSLATSVVATENIDRMKSDHNTLIYRGVGGNRFKDQNIEQGPNRALKNNKDQIKPVRVIYGYKVKIGGDKSEMRYTYYGLYYVKDLEKKEEIVSVENECYKVVVYEFKLERINQDEVVVRQMVCELDGGSCSKNY